MKPSELMAKWLENAEVVMGAHYDAARLFEKRHYWIGIPAVVLSAGVGTTVFASLTKEASLSLIVRIATGAASVLAAILTGLQTFLRYDHRAEKHKTAGADYAALVREIQQELAFPRQADELHLFADSIRPRFDKLSNESPTLPGHIFERAITE